MPSPSRRKVLLGLCSGAAVGFTARMNAAEPPVQLLVFRNGQEPIICGEAEYLSGTLYGVPSSMVLEDVVTTIGLEQLGRVEEPAYEGTTAGSSIPPGTYDAFIKDVATKPWMTTLDRRWRIELTGVEHRSAIQFHYGKDYTWSTGCIVLVGDQQKALTCSTQANSSEALVAKLRAYVETHSVSSPIRIRVRLAFEAV